VAHGGSTGSVLRALIASEFEGTFNLTLQVFQGTLLDACCDGGAAEVKSCSDTCDVLTQLSLF
jgi:hypothetical protein